MNKDGRQALLFLLPLAAFIIIFLVIPVLGAFWISLHRDVAFLSKKFIGLENYIRLIKDPGFIQAAVFTLLFTVVSTLLEMVFGIITALTLNSRIPFRNMTRGIALLPWAVPGVIGARIWQLIYRYDYGPANWLLEKTFGFSANWLGTPLSAFLSLVLADVWRTVPFVAIIILTGLQAVPETLYKQAEVDGAGIMQKFFRITLPMLKPIIIVALLFRTIDALRVFDVIYVITGGGPGGATASLSLYGYEHFLISDFGYGCSISFVLFLIAFFLALTYVLVGRFRESTV